MQQQALDWRLDAPLRAACSHDIEDNCLYERDNAPLVAADASSESVLQCLQGFRHDLTDPRCMAAVHRTLARGASDVRFAPALQQDCAADLAALCADAEQVCRCSCCLCLRVRRAVMASMCRGVQAFFSIREGDRVGML